MQYRLQSWGEHFRWVEEKFVSKNCQLLIVRVKGSFLWNRIRFKTLSSFIAHTLSVLTPPKSQRLLGGMRVVWTLREWRSSTKCTFVSYHQMVIRQYSPTLIWPYEEEICRILQSKMMCYTCTFSESRHCCGMETKASLIERNHLSNLTFFYPSIDRCCTRSAN